MAKSVNKVILIGNLGKDPEVKYTQGGMAVARFSLATTERVKDKDGNWQDRTEWHNLVAFQRTAEIAAEYLKKGGKVYIEGASAQRFLGRQGNRPEEVQDRDHHQRPGAAWRPRDGGGEGGGYRRADAGGSESGLDQSTPEPEPSQAPAGAEITDEDIPFCRARRHHNGRFAVWCFPRLYFLTLDSEN